MNSSSPTSTGRPFQDGFIRDLFIAILVTIVLGLISPTLIPLGLAILSVVIVYWRVRHAGNAVLTPIVRIDLVRLSRRGLFFLFRVAYAATLLVVLYLLYLQWFGSEAANPLNLNFTPGIHLKDQARFAESFFQSFTLTQLAAVYLFTPAYVAGVIAEEKDRGTLEFLFVSDLENREIIWSKLASRLLHMLLFLLTGLPVLMLSTFFGGVDPMTVIVGFVSALFTMLSLSGTSLLCSVYSDRVLTAMVNAYLIAAGHFAVLVTCCCSMSPVGRPFLPATLISDGGLCTGLVAPVMIHGWLAGLCFKWAGTRLRAWYRIRASQKARLPETTDAFTGRSIRRPPLRDDWLSWKERHCSSLFRFGTVGDVVFNNALIRGGGMLAVLAAIATAFDQRAFFVPGVVVLCVMILLAAVRAAYSIGSERDRNTFEELLVVPVENADILIPRWWSAIWFVRFWCVPLAVCWLIACLTKAMHPLAPPLLILAGGIHLAFATTLGLWCSLRCATTFRAIMWTLVVLFTLSAVPPLFGPGFRVVLSPVGMLVAVATLRSVETYGTIDAAVAAALDQGSIIPGFGLYALSAFALWWWTNRRFGAIAGRMPYGSRSPAAPR